MNVDIEKMKSLIDTTLFYYPEGLGHGTKKYVVAIIDVIQDDKYGCVFEIKFQNDARAFVLSSTLITGSKEEMMLSLLEN